jgi:hypothetical protein
MFKANGFKRESGGEKNVIAYIVIAVEALAEKH